MRPIAAAAAALFLAPALFAHPNGTSKVSIRLLDPDSVTVEADVNRDDLASALANLPRLTPESDRREYVRLFQEAMAHYLLSRLRVSVDGRGLGLRLLRWKPGGQGPEDGLVDDSLAFWQPTQIVTFAGRLPPSPQSLRVEVAFFPELSVQPISEVSIYWRDTVVERKWLVLDKALGLPLHPDTLQARYEAALRAPAGDAGGEGLFARFLGLGFIHILPRGLDHILFVAGLFFFSIRLRPLIGQITAFTAAHSITLGLAAAGAVALPAKLVEPVIALSIAVVGIENIFFRRMRASRWLVVFVFGLVHGLGFAGVMREFSLPAGQFWTGLLAFNLGVELGQLAVVAGLFALTTWFRNRPWYFARLVVPASALIAAFGLYWTLERLLSP